MPTFFRSTLASWSLPNWIGGRNRHNQTSRRWQFGFGQIPLHHRRRGYTLIEMMIVVTVILLITGGGIASYLTFNDRQLVTAQARTLQTLIRSAQTKARVGDRPEDCATLQGYKVGMAAGSSTVSVVAICDDNQEVPRQEQNLDSSVTNSSAWEVTFFVLHGGADQSAEISLESDRGRVYQFAINQGGEVSEGTLYDADEIPNSSPTSSPTASASPSSSPSSSPTNNLIVVNESTAATCTQVCGGSGFTGCWSVGTDGDGSNGKRYASYGYGEIGVCYQTTAGCNTIMTNKGTTCNGRLAEWTVCHCYNSANQ